MVTTSTCLQRTVSFACFHSLETDGPNVYTKEMMFDAMNMLSVNTLSCCHGTYSLRQMQKKKKKNKKKTQMHMQTLRPNMA